MVKFSQFYHPARFFKKKKDKYVGRGNNMNNFNGGGDGGKKKEKNPSKVQDRVQQTMKLLELENTESDHGSITEFDDITINRKVPAFIAHFRFLQLLRIDNGDRWLDRSYSKMDRSYSKIRLDADDDGGDDDSNGDDGGNDDNDGDGGGTNNKKGSDRDGDGDGDKYKSDRDGDGGGEMKGKNMDFMGKAGFGYRYRYHVGNENGYQVEQLQCAQEVQSSKPQCLSKPYQGCFSAEVGELLALCEGLLLAQALSLIVVSVEVEA